MTVLEALGILEAAVLECKKRNVNTLEVKEALDLLERYIYPKWLDSAVSPPCRESRTTFGKARRSTASVTRHFPRYSQLCSRTSRSPNGCAGAEVSRDTRYSCLARKPLNLRHHLSLALKKEPFKDAAR